MTLHLSKFIVGGFIDLFQLVTQVGNQISLALVGCFPQALIGQKLGDDGALVGGS